MLEPLFNSEWGTYKDTYDSVGNATGFSRQLYLMNLPGSYVMGSQVFFDVPAQSVIRFDVAAGDQGQARYQWQQGRP